MASSYITYKKGYKYQLVETYEATIPIHPSSDITTEYITLSMTGKLRIYRGYAWDGPSGPAIDTNNFMRPSLIHDALYQLMRNGYLDRDKWREPADRLLRQMCLEDGMSQIRAWWVYIGVRFGGGLAADPAHAKPVLYAPRACLAAVKWRKVVETEKKESELSDVPGRPCFDKIHEDSLHVVSCDEYGPGDCLHKEKGGCWDDCNSGKLSPYYQPNVDFQEMVKT